MENIKVCLVDVSGDGYDTNPREWIDDEFMAIAKDDGYVFTLHEFEDAFNEFPFSKVDSDNMIIRFI